jgi:hypothetical protein
MIVEFIKNYNGYQKKGDIVDVNTPLALYLIQEKICIKQKMKQND